MNQHETEQTQRLVTLPITDSEPYEIFAVLMSYLICPSDDERRFEIEKQLCRKGLYYDETLWPSKRRDYIFEANLKPRECIRIDKDLRNRLNAGYMAEHFMFERTPSGDALFPNECRTTLYDLCVEYQNTSDPWVANIQSRVWYPSLPVLHLAMAIRAVMYDKKTNDLFSSKCLTHVPFKTCAANFFFFARFYERVIDHTPKLKTASERLIRFREPEIDSLSQKQRKLLRQFFYCDISTIRAGVIAILGSLAR